MTTIQTLKTVEMPVFKTGKVADWSAAADAMGALTEGMHFYRAADALRTLVKYDEAGSAKAGKARFKGATDWHRANETMVPKVDGNNEPIFKDGKPVMVTPSWNGTFSKAVQGLWAAVGETIVICDDVDVREHVVLVLAQYGSVEGVYSALCVSAKDDEGSNDGEGDDGEGESEGDTLEALVASLQVRAAALGVPQERIDAAVAALLGE